MTVCVAAFAAESEAIVLIADKAITMGPMMSDTSICKVSRIGKTNWLALIAGTIPICDAVIARCEQAISKTPTAPDSMASMMTETSRAYLEIYEEEMIASVLQSRLLTKADVFQRSRHLLPLPDTLNDEITDARKDFERDWQCELLICGFDVRGQCHLFRVVVPGRAYGEDRMGFAAIGIGADSAIGRLMHFESDRDDELAKVLWDAFDAKVSAEIMQGVGYKWDAYILLKSKPTEAIEVPEKLQEVMDNVITASMASPFDPEPPKPDDIPPDDWKEQIRRFTESLIPKIPASPI
jgi:20S proteasome alpha/beta subunit